MTIILTPLNEYVIQRISYVCIVYILISRKSNTELNKSEDRSFNQSKLISGSFPTVSNLNQTNIDNQIN